MPLSTRLLASFLLGILGAIVGAIITNNGSHALLIGFCVFIVGVVLSLRAKQ